MSATPLHKLIKCSDVTLRDIRRACAENGEWINKRDGASETPLTLACNKGKWDIARCLVAEGANVNKVGDGETALIIALEKGNTDFAKWLVGQGADVNMFGPLRIAIENNDYTTAKFLIANGADVGIDLVPVAFGAEDGRMVDLLLQNGVDLVDIINNAAATGRLAIVKAVVEKGVDVDATNEKCYTPLIDAARNGHLNVVKWLVGKGAQVNFTILGSNSLLYALDSGHTDVARFLVGKGANVNCRDKSSGMTPFLAALECGDQELAKELVEHHANIVCEDKRGRTPLHIAAEKNLSKIAQFLLANNADANKRDSDGFTPLYYAANGGKLGFANVLINHGADINASGNNGRTPLHAATMNGFLKVITLLLEKGADVDCVDKEGFTPVHFASKAGHPECLEFLLNKGARVNMVAKGGITPLYLAVQCGFVKTSSVLLDKGASVKIGPTNEKDSLLYAAVQSRKVEIVSLLISHGIDMAGKGLSLNEAARNGDSKIAELLIENGYDLSSRRGLFGPEKIARDNGHNQLADYISRKTREALKKGLIEAVKRRDVNTLEKMIAEGCDVNFVSGGVFPLLAAAENGYLDCVKLLISKKANIDKSNSDGTTALLAAVEKGHLGIVQFLVENNASVNCGKKVTPLHLATMNGNVETVKLLLKRKANPNARDSDGNTAFGIAKRKCFKEIADLLEAAGACLAFDDQCFCDAVRVGDKKFIDWMLANGGNVKAKTPEGFTLLHIAAQYGHLELITFFTDKKFSLDLNCVTQTGLTPLHLAVEKNHLEIVQFLLQKGATPLKKSSDGLFPLNIAKNNGNAEMIQILETATRHRKLSNAVKACNKKTIESSLASGSLINPTQWMPPTFELLLYCKKPEVCEIFSLLLEKGADVNAQYKGVSLLHVLISSPISNEDRLKCAEILFAKGGVDVNCKNSKGDTPLLYLISYTLDSVKGTKTAFAIKFAECLLANGCNPNEKNSEGLAPLHILSRDPSCDKVAAFVQLLLDKGADPNCADDDKLTAIDGCEGFKVKELLKKRGCKSGHGLLHRGIKSVAKKGVTTFLMPFLE